jgi:hypothetical protein
MSMRQGSGDRVEGAHAMRAGPAGGVVASAIFGVTLLVARTLAAKIERNPDPFPMERLAREPDGTEVCIARPDGTTGLALLDDAAIANARLRSAADLETHPQLSARRDVTQLYRMRIA